MPSYEIVFARSARKELQNLSRAVSERILDKIELLAKDPRAPDSRKLHGYSNLWRIRIGEYRVVYSIDDKSQIITVFIVRHRSDAYR
jgi:mRNA interferase RelE/StbE